MKSDLFEAYELLMKKEDCKPEQLRSLIYEFDCYISEKISIVNDLKWLQEKRLQDSKEACVLRDQLKEKMNAKINQTSNR